jgi:hypothetical protein
MKFFLILVGAALPMSVGLSQSPEKKTCADLSGNYAFEGHWEKLEADGPNAKSIRESVLRIPPRFDERVLGIFARSVINPRNVLLKHDLVTGTLVVDILGSGISNQWKQYGPFLPAQILLACGNGQWLRETVSYGKGGFSSTESHTQIYIQLDANGDIKAEGEESIRSGLVFVDKLVLRWGTKFRKQNGINGVTH